MPTRDHYEPGVPCWVDLQTPDVDAAVAFYGTLFGWQTRRIEVDGGGEYLFFTHGDHQVAGCAAQAEEARSQGMPSLWTTYLAGDADAVAERVTSAGGTVVLQATDVMEEGRIALVADPTGAVVGIWGAGRHHGAELVNEPGSLVWNELATTDLEAASSFYTEVFGYGTEDETMGDDATYRVFTVEGEQVCGAYELLPEMADLPPHWACYFAVEDADAAAAAAAEAGGSVVREASDTPYGRMAVLADPTGATFLVGSQTSTD